MPIPKARSGRTRDIALAVMFGLWLHGGIMPWVVRYAIVPSALKQPDAAHGITAALETHGTTVYVASWVSLWITTAMIGFFLGWAIFIFMAVTQRRTS